MLPRAHRLVKKRDFERVYRYGYAYFSPLVILKFAKNNQNEPRFGFIVGNKISKKATKRNKIKRSLRAIIKTRRKNIKSGYDYILIGRQAILGKKYSEIEREIERLFKKSKQVK